MSHVYANGHWMLMFAHFSAKKDFKKRLQFSKIFDTELTYIVLITGLMILIRRRHNEFTDY